MSSDTNVKQSSTDKAIVVCGATGYIGTHLVSWLRSKNVPVKCLVRTDSASSNDIGLLEVCGAEVVRADLTGSKPLKPSVISLLLGSSAMVNLVGSIVVRRGETLDSLHVEHTTRLINLCAASGIPKMVMLTAAGTHESAASKYHISKWKAEQELIKSGLSYVILRPSLVYGRQVGQRNSKLVRRFMELIADRPVVPLIGGGHNRLQPIYVGDLIRCIELSLAPGEHDNRCLELGGPDVVDLKQFIELLMKSLGQSKPFVDLPVVVARSIAALCELTQAVPMLSRDQVTLTLSDNICEHNCISQDFRIDPTPLAEGLKSYAVKAAISSGCSGVTNDVIAAGATSATEATATAGGSNGSDVTGA